MSKGLTAFVTAALLATGTAAKTLPNVPPRYGTDEIENVLKGEHKEFKTSYECGNVEYRVKFGGEYYSNSNRYGKTESFKLGSVVLELDEAGRKNLCSYYGSEDVVNKKLKEAEKIIREKFESSYKAMEKGEGLKYDPYIYHDIVGVLKSIQYEAVQEIFSDYNDSYSHEKAQKSWKILKIVIGGGLSLGGLLWILSKLVEKYSDREKEKRIKDREEYREFLAGLGVNLNDPDNPLLSDSFIEDMLVQLSKLKKEIRNTLGENVDLEGMLKNFETFVEELKENHRYDHDKLVEIHRMCTEFNKFYKILEKYGINIVSEGEGEF